MKRLTSALCCLLLTACLESPTEVAARSGTRAGNTTSSPCAPTVLMVPKGFTIQGGHWTADTSTTAHADTVPGVCVTVVVTK